MDDYYSRSLSGERLRRCYEAAPPRVKQYLDAEIAFVISRVKPTDTVLELGCGYGRAAQAFAPAAGKVVGIDTSSESIELARREAPPGGSCEFLEMNALDMVFPDDHFDVVACIQNGISAFGVDRLELLREAVRVARPGGRILFSSYSGRFWPDRLEWFEIQADLGLVGEIDRDATGDGVIVCRDGFRATTVTPGEFESLSAELGMKPEITEVDGSSLFCELVK